MSFCSSARMVLLVSALTACGDDTGKGGGGAGGVAPDGGSDASGGGGGIVGAPPEVAIVLPMANALVAEADQPLEVQGTALDAEDGDITSDLLLIWRADDGADPIAEGTHNFAEVNLPVGPHVIHFTATDSDGNTATASVDITIE